MTSLGDGVLDIGGETLSDEKWLVDNAEEFEDCLSEEL